MSNATPTPLSKPVKTGWRLNGVQWFLLAVFLVSAGFFCAFTLRPVLQIRLARHWQETPCTIDSSQIEVDQGDESTAYRIDIVYHYTSAGQSYQSGRYDFTIGMTDGPRRKQAVVERYPPGKETTCFVNPRAPADAVLDRGWRPEMGLGIFGLFFAVPGAMGIVVIGQAARSQALRGSAVELTPRNSPRLRLFRNLAGALVWNGVTGIAAYVIFFVADTPDVERVPKIIIGVFVLVGVMFLWNALIELFRQREAKP